jgi:hypothetical protein
MYDDLPPRALTDRARTTPPAPFGNALGDQRGPPKGGWWTRSGQPIVVRRDIRPFVVGRQLRAGVQEQPLDEGHRPARAGDDLRQPMAAAPAFKLLEHSPAKLVRPKIPLIPTKVGTQAEWTV